MSQPIPSAHRAKVPLLPVICVNGQTINASSLKPSTKEAA